MHTTAIPTQKALQADITNVKLGATYQSIIDAFGEPLTYTTKDGVVIIQYHSNTPTFAQYLFFQNDHVVFKQIGRAKTPETLADYTNQFGKPELSVKRFDANTQDSLGLTVHVWPQKGRAIITEGINEKSSVYQLHEFAPTTLPEYSLTWGRDFAQNQIFTQAVNQNVQSVASTTATPTTTVVTKSNNVLPIFAITLILLIIGIIIWKRRRLTRNHE